MGRAEKIVCVGAGRLVRAIIRTVPERVVSVLRRTVSPDDAFLAEDGREVATSLSELQSPFDTLWIATSDRSIAEVARELAEQKESWSGILVLHSSGASGLSLLEPFRERGATIIALHPNWGATGLDPIPPGVFWGLSALDDAGKGAGEELVALFGGRTIAVEESRRGLYHAAASTASNFSVTLYVMALALYDAAGIDLDDAEEIVRRFMLDSVTRIVPGNPIGALTGPIVRGDRDVVRMQMEAIRKNTPELFETFQALVRLTTSLVDAGR